MRKAWREEYLYSMAAAGAPLRTARALARLTATAHRLAEAACSGYWPADNGERAVEYCPDCGGGWVSSSYRRPARGAAKVCPDCYTDGRIKALVASELPGWAVETSGDPRGCVVVVTTPDGRRIGVPA